MTEVSAAEQRVRALTNHYCRHESLYRRTGWLNYCAALDVLGDTSEAVDVFRGLHSENGQGLQYLHLHGLLQVLYLQGMAAAELQSFLRLKRLGFPRSVQEIRRIRDQATGHPTRQGKNNAHFIVRATMSRDAFTIYSFEGTERLWRTHSVDNLIARNTEGVCEMLDQCEKELRMMPHVDSCDAPQE